MIAYDIPSDRRRTRVADTLEDYGQRVQYSVFEARLTTDQLVKLKQELAELVDPAQDSVRFYRLCNACYALVEILGRGQVAADQEAIIL